MKILNLKMRDIDFKATTISYILNKWQGLWYQRHVEEYTDRSVVMQ